MEFCDNMQATKPRWRYALVIGFPEAVFGGNGDFVGNFATSMNFHGGGNVGT